MCTKFWMPGFLIAHWINAGATLWCWCNQIGAIAPEMLNLCSRVTFRNTEPTGSNPELVQGLRSRTKSLNIKYF